MPGESSLPATIQTRDETKAAFEQLILAATTALNIVSCRLNPALFNDPGLSETLRQKILQRRRIRIRVLIREPRQAVGNAPRFLALARRLGSNFEMRAMPRDTSLTASLIICDRHSMIYRPSFERWDGQLVSADPIRIKECLESFDSAWDNADQTPELRELSL
ncbi:MAG: hypothetical protein IIB68_03165 [Proteobacteria bacterium]|nr:hypothetical protein [Pseudomonadota bacterium]